MNHNLFSVHLHSLIVVANTNRRRKLYNIVTKASFRSAVKGFISMITPSVVTTAMSTPYLLLHKWLIAVRSYFNIETNKATVFHSKIGLFNVFRCVNIMISASTAWMIYVIISRIKYKIFKFAFVLVVIFISSSLWYYLRTSRRHQFPFSFFTIMVHLGGKHLSCIPCCVRNWQHHIKPKRN